MIRYVFNPFTGNFDTVIDPHNIDGDVAIDGDLSVSGDLIGTLILRKDTKTNMDAITLAAGEPGWSTDSLELRVGDGSTAGGVRLQAPFIRYKRVPTGQTIQSVIDSISDNSSSKIYVIELDSITYTENVVLKDYIHLRGNVSVNNNSLGNSKITSSTTGTVKVATNNTIENVLIENTASGGYGLVANGANPVRISIKNSTIIAPVCISTLETGGTQRTASNWYIEHLVLGGTDETKPYIKWSGAAAASATNVFRDVTTLIFNGNSTNAQSVGSSIIEILGNTRISWINCHLMTSSTGSAVYGVNNTANFTDNSTYYNTVFRVISSHASGTVDGYKMGTATSGTANFIGGQIETIATSGATATDINTSSAAGTAKVVVNGTRFNTYSGTALDGVEKAVYASGTAYALTNTAAKIDFGTNDPEVVLPAGVWRLSARVVWKKNAATHAANRTLTFKLRDTTNSADVANSSTAVSTGLDTTITQTMSPIVLPMTIFRATAATTIQLWGSIDTVASAGSDDIVEADIFAERIR